MLSRSARQLAAEKQAGSGLTGRALELMRAPMGIYPHEIVTESIHLKRGFILADVSVNTERRKVAHFPKY